MPCLYMRERSRYFGKPVPGSIPTIIRSFKSAASKRYHELIHNNTSCTWQSNYYEHIIRNEQDLLAITDYIMTNPLSWAKDEENRHADRAGLHDT